MVRIKKIVPIDINIVIENILFIAKYNFGDFFRPILSFSSFYF